MREPHDIPNNGLWKVVIDQVIDRMKYVLGVEHDVQLARALGVAQNVISGWKRRSSVPWQTLLKLHDKLHDEYGVCLNWLVLGQPSLDYAYQYPPIETKAIPYRGAEGLEEIMWKWGLNMAISPGWDHLQYQLSCVARAPWSHVAYP